MFFKKKKKFMVIGIDGVPYELLKDFARSGVMPHTQRLIETYGLTRTRAPLPEVSSVSWTSFMTGMNPGQHGVYGFMELNPDNYGYTFPSFPQLPVKTVWETLEERKKRSVIINLPGTYPARPMKGALVSGFVALELARAVYPPSLLKQLQAMDYRVDVDTQTGKDEKAFFLEELEQTLRVRYDLYNVLAKKEKWDLLFFIITGTDRLHHFFFDAVTDTQSPYYNAFRNYYRMVDTVIGDVTATMEKKGIPFIILSDHGFVKIKQEVYLSQYLREWGYLDIGDATPRKLKNMTPKTRAFALDPSRLYLHMEGKYQRGRVTQAESEPLRRELKNRFTDLQINGEKVIREVFFKEEIYHGDHLDTAPDLVLLSHHGFDLKAGVTKDIHFGKTFFEGMHSQDNAVLIDSFGFDLDQHPWIYDIGRALPDYF